MCVEGVSVWFACKLCKSFFLNADDFAYHKKKSHIQEFRNTKFIVFEEQQTSLPVSPPENWVSFLSPKEETRIHKIISSPPPPTTRSVDCNPDNENIPSNRNEPCIEIDPERNKNLNDHRHNTERDDEDKNSSNSCVKLNSNLNDDAPIDDVDDQENDKSQSKDAGLKDEKREKLCVSKLKAPLKRKTNTLRRSTRQIQNLPTNNEALLQSVIQSRNNPYVYLERLNLINIQKPPSSTSNSTIPIPSQENDKSDTNHNNSDAKSAKQPKVKCENKKNIVQKSSAFTSPPNAHNRTLHSTTSISTTTLEAETTAKGHQPQLGDELEVASRNEIQSDFPPIICNQSSVNELVLSSNHGDHNVYNNSDFHPADFELGPVLNAGDNNDADNLVPDPNTERTEVVNFNNFGPFFELVKTEYVTQYENENNTFPNNEDRDPFESVSQQMESLAGLTPNLAASSSSSSSDLQADSSRLCISCQKYFNSIRELKAHNRSEHGTQYGNKNFKCPFPNCEATRGNQYLLRMHLMQVHSNDRPYNCSHPNCTMSFKTKHCRSSHLRRVHRKTSSSFQVSNTFETETTNEDVSHSNHHSNTEPEPELAPQTDSFRYCIPCKKSFVSLSEIRNHYKTYHMTQEGKLLFSCPYPNCTTTTSGQWLLKRHLIQVHSKARPFKCPHPTCKMSFKTTSSRNRHFKSHTKTAQST